MDAKYAQYNYNIATVTATAVPEQQSMDNGDPQVPTVVGAAVDPGQPFTTRIPTHKICMNLDDDAIHGGFPPELRNAGMTEATWGAIVKAVEDGKRENPFHNCPTCEGIYWCCPGLCLQCTLCLIFNPCSWYIVAKSNGGIRQAADSVGQHLQRSNAQWDCKAEFGMTREYIVLYPRGDLRRDTS